MTLRRKSRAVNSSIILLAAFLRPSMPCGRAVYSQETLKKDSRIIIKKIIKKTIKKTIKKRAPDYQLTVLS